MSKFCPVCGEKLVDGAKFCKNCGAELNENQTVSPQETSENYEVRKVERDYTTAIVLGYICAFLLQLVGLVIGVYLITRNDSDKANFHGKLIIASIAIIWFLAYLMFSGYYVEGFI